MAIDYTNVRFVTLYTGDNGSGACTCHCPCCSQKGRERRYQGSYEQIDELFAHLPNLQQLYVLGNPDPSVDRHFCNRLMKEAISRGVRVCACTSGIGGTRVLEDMLRGVPAEMTDYLSFSFDATTQREMSFFKGVKYPMDNALEGVEWALKQGYPVKVQPTLWPGNYRKVKELMEFFITRGVTWFTFHVGSLESGVYMPSHRHLTAKELQHVHQQIDAVVAQYPHIKVRCPNFFNGTDDEKYHCMKASDSIQELLMTFTPEGIRATHMPIASAYTEKVAWILGEEAPEVPCFKMSKKCPYSQRLTGGKPTQCRFVSKYWGYS